MLLIDVFIKSESKPSPENFRMIINLFSLMNPNTPERETFVQNALRWSNFGTSYKNGHPTLHQDFAEIYWRGKFDFIWNSFNVFCVHIERTSDTSNGSYFTSEKQVFRIYL